MLTLDLPTLRLRLRELRLSDFAVLLLPPGHRFSEAILLAPALYSVRDIAAEPTGADLGTNGLGKVFRQRHGVFLGCHTIDHTDGFVHGHATALERSSGVALRPRRAGSPAAILIRPDGYVGLRISPADGPVIGARLNAVFRP